MRYDDYLQHLDYNEATGDWRLIQLEMDDNFVKSVSDIHETPDIEDLAIDHIDGLWLQNVPPRHLPTRMLALYREQKAQQMAFNIQEGRDEIAAQRKNLEQLELDVANAEVELLEYLTLD